VTVLNAHEHHRAAGQDEEQLHQIRGCEPMLAQRKSRRRCSDKSRDDEAALSAKPTVAALTGAVARRIAGGRDSHLRFVVSNDVSS